MRHLSRANSNRHCRPDSAGSDFLFETGHQDTRGGPLLFCVLFWRSRICLPRTTEHPTNPMPTDVVIVGAGAAGLAAAIDLSRAGLRVEILEARDRIGGRIYTQHDPTTNHSVDLGAEFIHGLTPEIWLPVQDHSLKVTEVHGDLWCSIDGKLQRCNFFAQADKILSAMDDDFADNSKADESFVDFLSRRFPGKDHEQAKQWATGYVSGFNAADPGLVSARWLVHGRHADEQIEGDRAFHIAGGYQTLLDIFSRELNDPNVNIRLNTIVTAIKWKAGSIEVLANGPQAETTFEASRTLVTLPLGVLQTAGFVRFEPELPQQKLGALEKLAMGKVVRVILCFRERFWQDLHRSGESRSLADLSFLFSRDNVFPTWWTQMPETFPIITGWAPAKSAEKLAGLGKDEVVDKAIQSLSSLLQVQKSTMQAQLQTAYFHDWDSDPYSLGAYSYVKVGGQGCQRTLGSPVADTLFFAGEATDMSGHNGTVHGAIASGQRAAREILKSK
ncbi:MAG: flavin monoamine oxidase family protein [Terriglobales bacterium]